MNETFCLFFREQEVSREKGNNGTGDNTQTQMKEIEFS